MNKTELVKAVAQKANMKINDTEALVNSFMDTVTDELKRKGKVTLVGFGTFKTAHRNAKTGVNPKTGQSIQIPAKDVPVFKPGKALKESIK